MKWIISIKSIVPIGITTLTVSTEKKWHDTIKIQSKGILWYIIK